MIHRISTQRGVCRGFRVFLPEMRNHYSYFIAGDERNSTMKSYKLNRQISAGQRVEFNIPLKETYWAADGDSLIDQTQFQSKCGTQKF